MEDNILIKINKSKYNLLDKINPDYIDIIVDNIFELGYHSYFRNYIKQEIINDNINYITENKLSFEKGNLGENIVYNILIEKMSDCIIENTSKIPHSGDIQIILPSKNRIIVEVKNYNKTIDQEQIEKLKFDMKYSNIYCALFVSLNSGIVGKKRFELEYFKFDNKTYYIIYIPYALQKSIPNKKNMISHNSSLDDCFINLNIKLEFGICILQNIIDKFKTDIKDNKCYFINLDLDYITNELEKCYNDYKLVRNSANKMEENIKKNLESHLQVIKDYENNIKLKINNLIYRKIDNQTKLTESKIYVKKYKNNWNIIIDNLIYGKIIYIDNIYDLLINYKDFTINEQFRTLVECKNFIEHI